MLVVRDRGVTLEFSFEDLMRYHGPRSPGGVAHAYKVMERAFAQLDDVPERREVSVRTAFGGPGARDAFELVLRAVTGDRYVVDSSLARPELGRDRERFVFDVGGVTLVLRDGFVVPEFIDLARAEHRSQSDEARLEVLKREMADRVMAADVVYDVV